MSTENKLAEFLRKSADQLDKLQAQAIAEKADWSERWEDMKKDTLAHVHKIKADASALAEKGKDRAEELKAKLQHLEVQLALGKAETKDEIEKQKKNISEALHKLKHTLGI